MRGRQDARVGRLRRIVKLFPLFFYKLMPRVSEWIQVLMVGKRGVVSRGRKKGARKKYHVNQVGVRDVQLV